MDGKDEIIFEKSEKKILEKPRSGGTEHTSDGLIKSPLSSAFQTASKLPRLTTRGCLLVGIGILGVVFVAQPESDLSIWVLSAAAIILAFSCLALTILQGFKVRRGTATNAGETNRQIFSREEILSYFRLPIVKLQPLTQIKLKRSFGQGEIDINPLVYRGRELQTPSSEVITFPHRGVWRSEGFVASIEDAFGLSKWDFNIPSPGLWEVSAKPRRLSQLPVVAASTRIGEEQNLSDKRTGDLFDLKAYEKTDGIKRVLWKTYARTGELVVRRPEPAVLPDGEVAIFFVASDKEDHVAAALLGYIGQLKEAEVETIFSTDYQATKDQFFVKREKVNESINASVFSGLKPGSQFARFLGKLADSSEAPVEVIVFADKSIGASSIKSLSAQAASFNTRISFALVDPSLFGFLTEPKNGSFSKEPSIALAQSEHTKFIECRPLH